MQLNAVGLETNSGVWDYPEVVPSLDSDPTSFNRMRVLMELNAVGSETNSGVWDALSLCPRWTPIQRVLMGCGY